MNKIFSLLLGVMFFLSLTGYCQEDLILLSKEYKVKLEKNYPDSLYFTGFSPNSYTKEDNIDTLRKNSNKQALKLLIQKISNSIKSIDTSVYKEANSIIIQMFSDITTSQSYIKDLTDLDYEPVYFDKKNQFVYAFVHASKKKNLERWENLLESSCEDLSAMCSTLISSPPIERQNSLFICAFNKFENAEYYHMLLDGVFRNKTDSIINAKYIDARNAFYEVLKLAHKPIWEIHFPNNSKICMEIIHKNSNLEKVDYLHFTLKLSEDGYINAFLLSNDGNEEIICLYPYFEVFNNLGITQHYEMLFKNKEYEFPFCIPKDLLRHYKTNKPVYGYPVRMNDAKNEEEVAILVLYSKNEIPENIARQKSILGLKIAWEDYLKTNVNCSLLWEEITFKK